jgi:hypothetical protein
MRLHLKGCGLRARRHYFLEIFGTAESSGLPR